MTEIPYAPVNPPSRRVIEDQLTNHYCFQNFHDTIEHKRWLVKENERCKYRAFVFTDGSCRYPGRRHAKTGVGVFWKDDHPNNYSGTVHGVQNSSRAELCAAHHAIRQAFIEDYRAVTILSDCRFVRFVIDRPQDAAKSNYDDYRDLIDSINIMKKFIKVSVYHIKAHAGHYGNDQADKLARKAIFTEEELKMIGLRRKATALEKKKLAQQQGLMSSRLEECYFPYSEVIEPVVRYFPTPTMGPMVPNENLNPMHRNSSQIKLLESVTDDDFSPVQNCIPQSRRTVVSSNDRQVIPYLPPPQHSSVIQNENFSSMNSDSFRTVLAQSQLPMLPQPPNPVLVRSNRRYLPPPEPAILGRNNQQIVRYLPPPQRSFVVPNDENLSPSLNCISYSHHTSFVSKHSSLPQLPFGDIEYFNANLDCWSRPKRSLVSHRDLPVVRYLPKLTIVNDENLNPFPIAICSDPPVNSFYPPNRQLSNIQPGDRYIPAANSLPLKPQSPFSPNSNRAAFRNLHRQQPHTIVAHSDQSVRRYLPQPDSLIVNHHVRPVHRCLPGPQFPIVLHTVVEYFPEPQFPVVEHGELPVVRCSPPQQMSSVLVRRGNLQQANHSNSNRQVPRYLPQPQHQIVTHHEILSPAVEYFLQPSIVIHTNRPVFNTLSQNQPPIVVHHHRPVLRNLPQPHHSVMIHSSQPVFECAPQQPFPIVVSSERPVHRRFPQSQRSNVVHNENLGHVSNCIPYPQFPIVTHTTHFPGPASDYMPRPHCNYLPHVSNDIPQAQRLTPSHSNPLLLRSSPSHPVDPRVLRENNQPAPIHNNRQVLRCLPQYTPNPLFVQQEEQFKSYGFHYPNFMFPKIHQNLFSVKFGSSPRSL